MDYFKHLVIPLLVIFIAGFEFIVLGSSEKDYYDILGVDKTVSDQEIRKAYRRLAMKYHPDRNDDKGLAEERMVAINEAYEILTNPQKRVLYDKYGGFGRTGATNNHRGGNNFNDLNFNDFFSDNGGFRGFKFNNDFGGRRQKDSFKFRNFFHDDGGGDLFNKERRKEDDDRMYSHQWNRGGSFRRGATSQGLRDNQFQGFGGSNSRCETVTKRVGNTVTTYTTCS